MSSVNTNEEKIDRTDSKQKTAAIRDDFQGTATLIENGWDLMRHDGQYTLIDGNLEELIGWAMHMDGPCAPKKPPPSSQDQLTSKAPLRISEETSREEDKASHSVTSSLNRLDVNGERNNDARENGSLKPSSTEVGPPMEKEQGNKKRKRTGKPDTTKNNLSYQQFSSSSSNMLRSLPNIPIRPSVLQYLHNCFVEVIEKEETSNQEPERGNHPCWEAFDTSALVALGITAEEMLTAALIPLAEMHVHRCRQIVDDETSFEQWTLPPTEAIMKLMASQSPSFVSPLGSFPTTREPSRISKEAPDQDISQQVIAAWLNRHSKDQEEVHKLWHLYKFFLPSSFEPSETMNSKPRKRARTPVTAKEVTKTAQNEEPVVEKQDAMAYTEV